MPVYTPVIRYPVTVPTVPASYVACKVAADGQHFDCVPMTYSEYTLVAAAHPLVGGSINVENVL